MAERGEEREDIHRKEKAHGGEDHETKIGLLHQKQQKALDAETFAITGAIPPLLSRADSKVSTEPQATILGIQSNAPGPGQDTAIETISLAEKPYEQGNTMTVRWVPEHRGITGNKVAGVPVWGGQWRGRPLSKGHE